jgi:3-hydroxyacyl-CoA dehydrogenase
MTFTRAAVLGAGTMGAQIALHLANAGVPVVLLDVSREAARAGLDRARALKPDPQFTSDTWTRVRTGRFDDDPRWWPTPNGCSKQWSSGSTWALLEKVAAACRPDAVLTTNTSGIPVSAIARLAARTPPPRLAPTSSNPPRYLPLPNIRPPTPTQPSSHRSPTSAIVTSARA